MKYSASMHNVNGRLDVVVAKGDQTNSIDIAPGHNGFGSSISGGEILFLAIATCYCNDLYREGKKLGIKVDNVEVEVDGDFMAAGEPATNVKCKIKVTAQATEAEIQRLIVYTDSIAEIPMSLRNGTDVTVTEVQAIESK